MTIWYLVIAVVLLLANGFFVATQFALIAVPGPRLESLASAGDSRARSAIRSSKEISFMLAGTQLGITMASLGLGFVAEPAVAHLIERAFGPLDLSDGVAHSVAVVLGLAIVVFLHMVIGEMAPKNLTIAAPERTVLRVAIPFRLFANLFRPFIRAINAVSNLALRAMGVEAKGDVTPIHGAKELGFLISVSAREGKLDRFEHRLLSGAIVFSERDAASVMIPRTDVVAVPLSSTPTEIEQIALESGHSRFPVFAKNLDNVVGFFHAKDLLRVPAKERDKPIRRRFIRQMLIVPESLNLHPLLFEMRRQRQHFALVLDEHGGTAGIVTLEDLLEELVGEIRDEYDVAELGIERVSDGRYLIPGTLHVDEAESRLGLKLPDGEYETVAGFLMDQLGRIPRRRDLVEYDGWRLRVLSMHRRRVVQVLAEQTAPPAHEPLK